MSFAKRITIGVGAVALLGGGAAGFFAGSTLGRPAPVAHTAPGPAAAGVDPVPTTATGAPISPALAPVSANLDEIDSSLSQLDAQLAALDAALANPESQIR